jgi:hypothetical protein
MSCHLPAALPMSSYSHHRVGCTRRSLRIVIMQSQIVHDINHASGMSCGECHMLNEA